MAYFSEDEDSAESSQPEEESGEESEDRDAEDTHLMDEQLERTSNIGM